MTDPNDVPFDEILDENGDPVEPVDLDEVIAKLEGR